MIYGDDRLSAAIDRRNKMYAPKYLDAVRIDVIVVNVNSIPFSPPRSVVLFVEGLLGVYDSVSLPGGYILSSHLAINAAIKCGLPVSTNDRISVLDSGFSFGDYPGNFVRARLSPITLHFMLQMGATLYFSRVRAIANNGSLWEPVFRNSVLYRAVLMPNDFVIETYPFAEYIKARTVQPNVVEITFPEPLWWDARTVFFVTLPFNVPASTTQTVGSINLLDCVII